MKRNKIIAMLMVSTTVLSLAGPEIAHAATSTTDTKVTQPSKSSIEKALKDWKIDTSVPGKVKLVSYKGHDKDVVIPTADDLGYKGETAEIDRQGICSIWLTTTPYNGSIKTSSNGGKIKYLGDDMAQLLVGNFQGDIVKSSLTSVDLSNLEIPDVFKLFSLFAYERGMESLDISSFDTSKGTVFQDMLKDCTGLKKLTLGEKTYLNYWGNKNEVNLPDVPQDNVYTGKWINLDNPNQKAVTSTELVLLTSKTAKAPKAKVGTWTWQKISSIPQEVDALFSDSNHDTLAPGVTAETVSKVRADVEDMQAGDAKTEYTALVNKAESLLPKESIQQQFDFYGSGIPTDMQKETHFAQLTIDHQSKATLAQGINMYDSPIHSWLGGVYASIEVKDGEQSVFSQTWNASDKPEKKSESFNLKDGETVTIYHNEGASRLLTNDDKDLKTGLGAHGTFVYDVKDGKLVAHKETVKEGEQVLDFYGGSETHFAQLTTDGQGKATVAQGLNMHDSPVHAWLGGLYASLEVKDGDQSVFSQTWNASDKPEKKSESFDLKDGETVTIYHVEGASRFTTNDDKDLKSKAGSTYTYQVENNKLVLTSVK